MLSFACSDGIYRDNLGCVDPGWNMGEDREPQLLYEQLNFKVLVSTEWKSASLDSHLSVILLPFVII